MTGLSDTAELEAAWQRFYDAASGLSGVEHAPRCKIRKESECTCGLSNFARTKIALDHLIKDKSTGAGR